MFLFFFEEGLKNFLQRENNCDNTWRIESVLIHFIYIAQLPIINFVVKFPNSLHLTNQAFKNSKMPKHVKSQEDGPPSYTYVGIR